MTSDATSNAISRLSITGDEDNDTIAELLASTVRKRHYARDITTAFTVACQELRTGELVKHDSFTLWSAVQALEIMDPKMDSGYVAPGESFDTGYDVGRNLLPEEVLYIMDRILSLEMTWLRGFALFQTLLTSNHIYHILTSKDQIPSSPSFPVREDGADKKRDPRWLHLCLLAYCVNTIIQCDMTVELVTSQHYYEEEDLNTQAYQIRLLNDVTDEHSLHVLDEAIAWISSGDGELSPVEDAILDRLELRRGSLIRSLLSPQAFDPDSLATIIDSLEVTSEISKPVPSAFNPKQYRKISTTAPVRDMAEISLSEAVGDLRSLVETVNEQHHFIYTQKIYQSTSGLRNFLWMLASRTPRPHVLSRSIVQHQLFAQAAPLDGHEGTWAYLLGELSDMGFPDGSIVEGSFFVTEFGPRSMQTAIRQRLDEWAIAAKPAFFNVLRALCMNHCRMRRCLVNTLPSFDGIADACSLESQTHDPLKYLDATLHNTAQLRRWQVAAWITQLGFEHDVYQPHELSSTYEHLHSHLQHQLAIQRDQLVRLNAARLGTLPQPFRAPTAPVLAHMHAALLARVEHTRAAALVAQGFQLVHAVLQRTELVTNLPPRSLTTSSLRHELRSREYAAKQNEVPQFGPFHALALHKDTVDAKLPTLLDEADAALAEARTVMLEMVRNADPVRLEALGRTGGLDGPWKEDTMRCVRAGVEMKLRVGMLKSIMSGAIGEASGFLDKAALAARIEITIPTPAQRTHAWWVVPEVAVKGASKH